VTRLLAALAALGVIVLVLTRLHAVSSGHGDDAGVPSSAADAPWLRAGGARGDAAALAWRPSAVETLQCPSYSGPAWRKGDVPTRATVVAAEAMTTTAAAKLPPLPAAAASEGGRVPLSPLPLAAVRLATGGSPLAQGQALNSVYLMLLEPDRLLYSFRAQARLPQRGAEPYRGWEDPGSELRGHFVGHYLSAASAAVAATGDAALETRLDAVLAGLLECQASSGYLSAFPEELLDRYDSQRGVWAPYYTLHKILQGLVDVHTHSRNGRPAALDAALALARYIGGRAATVVSTKGLPFWRECLHAEYGGIPEAMRATGSAVGGPAARELEALAELWDKPCFHGPLAAGGDELNGLHANTHLPLGPAACARYAATGERAFLAAAARLFRLVNDTRSFATGGTSHGELWHGAHELGPHAAQGGEPAGGTHSAESCATHNALKLAAWLLRVAPDVRYADFIERATLNGILGTLRGSDPGRYLYMYPMGDGVSKAARSQWREAGWSRPFEDFWCCTGTMIESFAKLSEGLYFQQPRARRLYVLHFASSTATWAAADALVTQTADTAAWTSPSRNASLRIELRVAPTEAGAEATRRASLVVRVPAWAAGPGLRASLNGAPLAVSPGAFLTARREWRAGDALQLQLPLGEALRSERIADAREPFRRLHALLWGPLVLAAITDGPRGLAATPSSLAHAAVPVPASARDAMASLRACGPAPGLYVAHADGGSNATRLASPPAELPGPALRRSGGTDAHAAATWRVVPLRGGEAIALEASHRPGAFLCPAEDAGAPPVLRTAIGSDPAVAPVPPCAEWAKRASAAPGAPPKAIALESLHRPGAFLAAAGAPGSATTAAALGVRAGGAADAAACFELAPPLATLPAVAFWARGQAPGRRFLLLPLQDIVDETFSAYVELLAESPQG
jgi:DUF1680 family protein